MSSRCTRQNRLIVQIIHVERVCDQSFLLNIYSEEVYIMLTLFKVHMKQKQLLIHNITQDPWHVR